MMSEKAQQAPINLWHILMIANIPVCVASLAGFLGRFGRLLDLSCHFRFQYFLCLLVATILFLLKRMKLTALGFGAFCALNACLLLPFYLSRPMNCPPGRSHRIIVINVNRYNQRYANVRDFIESEQPDAAVLIETDDKWKEELLKLGPDYPYLAGQTRKDCYGILMLSKLPILESTIQSIGIGAPGIVAKIDIGGRPLTIIGVHTLPPTGDLGFAERNRQLSNIGRLAASIPGPKMVTGDLNLTSWSPFFSDLLKNADLRDSRIGFGIQPSWPSFNNPLIRIPIDHVLVSREIVVCQRKLGPDLGSDHYPVVVDFWFQPQ